MCRQQLLPSVSHSICTIEVLNGAEAHGYVTILFDRRVEAHISRQRQGPDPNILKQVLMIKRNRHISLRILEHDVYTDPSVGHGHIRNHVIVLDE